MPNNDLPINVPPDWILNYTNQFDQSTSTIRLQGQLSYQPTGIDFKVDQLPIGLTIPITISIEDQLIGPTGQDNQIIAAGVRQAGAWSLPKPSVLSGWEGLVINDFFDLPAEVNSAISSGPIGYCSATQTTLGWPALQAAYMANAQPLNQTVTTLELLVPIDHFSAISRAKTLIWDSTKYRVEELRATLGLTAQHGITVMLKLRMV